MSLGYILKSHEASHNFLTPSAWVWKAGDSSPPGQAWLRILWVRHEAEGEEIIPRGQKPVPGRGLEKNPWMLQWSIVHRKAIVHKQIDGYAVYLWYSNVTGLGKTIGEKRPRLRNIALGAIHENLSRGFMLLGYNSPEPLTVNLVYNHQMFT